MTGFTGSSGFGGWVYPVILSEKEYVLLRPYRAFVLRGFVTQGVALGYDISPLQGLTVLAALLLLHDHGFVEGDAEAFVPLSA